MTRPATSGRRGRRRRGARRCGRDVQRDVDEVRALTAATTKDVSSNATECGEPLGIAEETLNVPAMRREVLELDRERLREVVLELREAVAQRDAEALRPRTRQPASWSTAPAERARRRRGWSGSRERPPGRGVDDRGLPLADLPPRDFDVPDGPAWSAPRRPQRAGTPSTYRRSSPHRCRCRCPSRRWPRPEP